MDENGELGAEYLQEWHQRHPGATSVVLGPLTDQSGRSSYELLAEAIRRGGEPVLDLACGDGQLLDLLRIDRSCLGADRSGAELHAAGERLGRFAVLMQADASCLPIATSAFGTVSCHYALMLLQPLEQVLMEIARVLRPDGLFAAVVPASPPDDAAGAISAFRTAWRSASEIYPVDIPSIQDDRAIDPERLSPLLAASGFTSVSVQSFPVSRSMTVDEAEELYLLTYLPDLLPPDGLAELRRMVNSNLAEIATDEGTVTFVQHSDLVTARRSKEQSALPAAE
jgi:SAM-dependent methyltransferase